MSHRHSVDEYLETIWFLAFPIGEYRPTTTGTPTLASRVAEMLGVSRASAGEMLKRLEKEGLVERGEHKEAILTRSGRKRAEGVVRRHRIIERLLTDFMGYTAAEAHVHADELGDTFTDDMIERMDERLGHPERCPHGWPVDTDLEQRENLELAPLSALGLGDRATIVRLAEHDGELLHWFYDQGLVPGTKLQVTSAQPAAGQVTVKLNGEGNGHGDRMNPVTKTVYIGEKAAGGLYVRPA
jgi:DtxR family Mn-dependent transcriptional regulator